MSLRETSYSLRVCHYTPRELLQSGFCLVADLQSLVSLGSEQIRNEYLFYLSKSWVYKEVCNTGFSSSPTVQAYRYFIGIINIYILLCKFKFTDILQEKYTLHLESPIVNILLYCSPSFSETFDCCMWTSCYFILTISAVFPKTRLSSYITTIQLALRKFSINSVHPMYSTCSDFSNFPSDVFYRLLFKSAFFERSRSRLVAMILSCPLHNSLTS